MKYVLCLLIGVSASAVGFTLKNLLLNPEGDFVWFSLSLAFFGLTIAFRAAERD